MDYHSVEKYSWHYLKLSSSELAPFLLSVDLETHRAGKDYDFVLSPNISLSVHLQSFVFEISLKVEGRILLLLELCITIQRY